MINFSKNKSILSGAFLALLLGIGMSMQGQIAYASTYSDVDAFLDKYPDATTEMVVDNEGHYLYFVNAGHKNTQGYRYRTVAYRIKMTVDGKKFYCYDTCRSSGLGIDGDSANSNFKMVDSSTSSDSTVRELFRISYTDIIKMFTKQYPDSLKAFRAVYKQREAKFTVDPVLVVYKGGAVYGSVSSDGNGSISYSNVHGCYADNITADQGISDMMALASKYHWSDATKNFIQGDMFNKSITMDPDPDILTNEEISISGDSDYYVEDTEAEEEGSKANDNIYWVAAGQDYSLEFKSASKFATDNFMPNENALQMVFDAKDNSEQNSSWLMGTQNGSTIIQEGYGSGAGSANSLKYGLSLSSSKAERSSGLKQFKTKTGIIFNKDMPDLHKKYACFYPLSRVFFQGGVSGGKPKSGNDDDLLVESDKLLKKLRIILKLDTEAPALKVKVGKKETTITADSTETYGWYKNSSKVSMEAEDKDSRMKYLLLESSSGAKEETEVKKYGVKKKAASLSGQEGIHTYTVTARDNVHNEVKASVILKIDTTAPNISHTRTGKVSTFTAQDMDGSDGTGYSGIRNLQILDASNAVVASASSSGSSPSETISASYNVSDGGHYTIKAWDYAGNVKKLEIGEEGDDDGETVRVTKTYKWYSRPFVFSQNLFVRNSVFGTKNAAVITNIKSGVEAEGEEGKLLSWDDRYYFTDQSGTEYADGASFQFPVAQEGWTERSCTAGYEYRYTHSWKEFNDKEYMPNYGWVSGRPHWETKTGSVGPCTSTVGSYEVHVGLDTKKPIITMPENDSKSGDPLVYGWYQEDTTLTFSAEEDMSAVGGNEDNCSGIRKFELLDASGNVLESNDGTKDIRYKFTQEGDYEYILRAYDNATADSAEGNKEEIRFHVKIDKTAPEISILSPIQYQYREETWYDSTTSFSFRATDTGGSHLKYFTLTEITPEEGELAAGDADGTQDTFTLSHIFDGNDIIYHCRLEARDNAGNITRKNCWFYISALTGTASLRKINGRETPRDETPLKFFMYGNMQGWLTTYTEGHANRIVYDFEQQLNDLGLADIEVSLDSKEYANSDVTTFTIPHGTPFDIPAYVNVIVYRDKTGDTMTIPLSFQPTSWEVYNEETGEWLFHPRVRRQSGAWWHEEDDVKE